MKSVKKSVAGIIMALVLVLAGVLEYSSVVKTAKADENPGSMYYDLDDEGELIERFFVAEGQNATECEIINPGDVSSQPATWADGTTYLFGFDLNTDTHTYNVDRVTVSGEVKLIILRGYTLNITGGINVPEGSSLTICGPGRLNCCDSVPNGCAAIGGNYACVNGKDIFEKSGTITIVGATVNATGGKSGAGIGGSLYGAGGNTRILWYSTVTAIGGDSAAGIGGGYDCSGGTITISGASVNATGGEFAAGIGGGGYGSGGTITIYESEVYANGGHDAAGIGSGYCGNDQFIVTGGTILIRSSSVFAKGGSSGAGIGGGYRASGGTITISEAYVSAEGGSDGAGIGGGYHRSGGEITIEDGMVIAYGGVNSAGIGGGYMGDGGTITISGGEISATGGLGGAGIGGSRGANGGDITISGGKVIAIGGNNDEFGNQGGAGIGSGLRGTGGTITITGGNVTATGGNYAAGIGGGSEVSGGIITISGGTVTATATCAGDKYEVAGYGGAGIGGGYRADGGEITIKGGTVTAQGVGGAGIGSGAEGDGGIINIFRGTVTANGGFLSAGIGGGFDGAGGTISISGGTVTANGGKFGGAGIGEGLLTGSTPKTQTITISGGTVIANGGMLAGGIGSGCCGEACNYCGKITISGGSVTATAGGTIDFDSDAVGIGGYFGEDDKIVISGGTVTAVVTRAYQTGIGSVSESYNGAVIEITGGTVVVQADCDESQWSLCTGIGDAPDSEWYTVPTTGTISIDFTDTSSVNAFNYKGTVTLESEAMILETEDIIPAGVVTDLSEIAGKTLMLGPDSIVFQTTLNMKDYTGINVYIHIPKSEESEVSRYTVETITNNTVLTSYGPQNIALAELPKKTRKIRGKNAEFYLIDVMHAASIEMTDTVVVILKKNGEVVKSKTYSVASVAVEKLSDSGMDATAKKLMGALLQYGYYAQVQFEHNDGSKPAIYQEAPVLAAIPADYAASGDPTNFSAYIKEFDAKLDCKDSVAINVYLTPANGYSLGSFEITILDKDGNIYKRHTKPVMKKGKIYIKIKGINSNKMDNNFRIVVKLKSNPNVSATWTRSVITCAYASYQRGLTENMEPLKNVTMALYQYFLASKEQFKNQ